MIKWLLVLIAGAALTWWATRPEGGARKRRRRDNVQMKQCPKCGVYVEQGGACRCQDKGKR